jgi:hypothetical protein
MTVMVDVVGLFRVNSDHFFLFCFPLYYYFDKLVFEVVNLTNYESISIKELQVTI